MQMDRIELEIVIAAIGLEEPSGPVDIDAELALLLARGRFGMGLRIDIGIDAKRGPRGRAEAFGNGGDGLELGLRLDVEPADARRERPFDLRIGLAHPGVNDSFRVHPRLLSPIQLAARDHVHPCAALGEQAQQVHVATALDRVTDQRVERRERLRDRIHVVLEGCLRVDVSRAAHLIDDSIDVGMFTAKAGLALMKLILKMVHDASR